MAALTQEQYDQWEELVGPNLYSQYGGQLYFEGFDGVVLRSCRKITDAACAGYFFEDVCQKTQA